MDALGVDWQVSMRHARSILGARKVICGNIDPIVLYGNQEQIKQSVVQCIKEAGERDVNCEYFIDIFYPNYCFVFDLLAGRPLLTHPCLAVCLQGPRIMS